ncbi:hypothetical protein [Streptomyces sp. NPDC088794]|uniref:zinc finger domain-containing protein n=1 Tax=Streptomyces sp. NPDC088794 TaxID=3365902 RepID=UPI0038015C9C
MTSRAERRHPEIEQRCPWEPCLAQPDRPCTNRRGEPRDESHGSRKDAWIRAHTDCPNCGASPGHFCVAAGGQPMTTHVHIERTHAAEAAYAAAVEAVSRDMGGGPR